MRPLKVVRDGDDITVALQGGGDFLVHPVVLLLVADASVQRLGRQDEEEVLRRPDRVEEIFVEFPRLQLFDVDENGEAAELQVNFEQTGQLRTIGPPERRTEKRVFFFTSSTA